MKTTSAIDHLILSSSGLTSEQFQRCKELLGHQAIVGSTDSGMSFPPENLIPENPEHPYTNLALQHDALETNGWLGQERCASLLSSEEITQGIANARAAYEAYKVRTANSIDNRIKQAQSLIHFMIDAVADIDQSEIYQSMGEISTANDLERGAFAALTKVKKARSETTLMFWRSPVLANAWDPHSWTHPENRQTGLMQISGPVSLGMSFGHFNDLPSGDLPNE